MTDERQREAPAPVDEGTLEGPQKPHQRLPLLISVAQAERDGAERRRLTREVVDALIAMRQPGDEADEARVLLAHLDASELSNLSDDQGRDAHVEAVETLLSLGFPHALSISPEDLAKFREAAGSLGGAMMQRRRWAFFGASALTAAAAAPHFMALSSVHRGDQNWALFSWAVGMLSSTASAGMLFNHWPRPDHPPGAVMTLAIAGAACLTTAMLGGPLALLSLPMLGVALALTLKK